MLIAVRTFFVGCSAVVAVQNIFSVTLDMSLSLFTRGAKGMGQKEGSLQLN